MLPPIFAVLTLLLDFGVVGLGMLEGPEPFLFFVNRCRTKMQIRIQLVANAGDATVEKDIAVLETVSDDLTRIFIMRCVDRPGPRVAVINFGNTDVQSVNRV